MITELKVGDYIEKSEIGTEQKYNDVVEVFKQWGFSRNGEHALSYCNFMNHERENALVASNLVDFDCMLMGCDLDCKEIQRKLTYSQVMSLKKTDVDNLNIDKVVSNEEVELEKSEPRNDYIFNPSNINWYMAPSCSDFYIHCEKRGLSGFGFMVGESKDCGFMVCKLVGRERIFNYDLLLEQDCIHGKPESVESNSELLKLHAAADGLIRLGYVWDEEEKAWCKINKEYL